MYGNIAETGQKPKTELSAKTVNGFNPLTIFAKSPIPGLGRVPSTSTLMSINIWEPTVEIFFT